MVITKVDINDPTVGCTNPMLENIELTPVNALGIGILTLETSPGLCTLHPALPSLAVADADTKHRKQHIPTGLWLSRLRPNQKIAVALWKNPDNAPIKR